MSALLLERDTPIWLAAKPWLDVRSNDQHTLVSYRLARALLDSIPTPTRMCAPAILLHDVGWKMVPEEASGAGGGTQAHISRILRVHEIEGVRIARETWRKSPSRSRRERVVAIIDGHDTRPRALPEDASCRTPTSSRVSPRMASP